MAAGADISQPVGAEGVVAHGGQLPGTGGAAAIDKEQYNGGSANGKPPRPVFTTTITACLTTTTTTAASPGFGNTGTVRKCVGTVRVAMSEMVDSCELQISDEKGKVNVDFVPLLRSGGWMDMGDRLHMEDEHVRVDDLGPLFVGERPGAFYGVFDGHCGKGAAHFVREHLLDFILEDVAFPTSIEEAVRHAFLQADNAFAEACLLNEELSSGTTAITALVVGRTLLVANVGDCRAVLSKRGKAVEMSRDHKPWCVVERARIEALGGFVDDGYLNGQLAVARALGDWHRKGLKEFGVGGPLIAEPEFQRATLTEEDEFLIIGCDGLWDVFTSQNAVDLARRELQKHNDPELCSKKLVAEALRRNTSDNVTVLTVCFHADCPPRLGLDTMPVRRSFSTEGLRNLQGLLDSCS